MTVQRYSLLPGSYAIVRLTADAPVPPWAWLLHEFIAVTRTRDELSIVCPADVAPRDARAETGWSLLKIEGPFPFDAVGILASFTGPLASAGIPLFAISTFDTDYLLIKSDVIDAARDVLGAAGHTML